MQRRLFNFATFVMSFATAPVVPAGDEPHDEHSGFGNDVSRGRIERDLMGEVRCPR